MSEPAPDTFILQADELLTMPEDAKERSSAPVGATLMERDAAITGLIRDAGIFVEGGHIAWFGPWEERPKASRAKRLPHMKVGVITPGWIDCHTHSVFAGERSQEFMWRNAGRPYVEILEEGGGIHQSVEATRAASLEELTHTLIERSYEFVRRGITALEVKTGYGLSLEDELKCLKAIEAARAEVPCELISCLLAAHAIPKEYKDRRADYVRLICEQIIPAASKLTRYCDVFCDRGAFTLAEAKEILLCGKKHGLIPRIHADEITHTGAAAMAATIGASSADHLEHTPTEDLKVMVEHGTVGVLMPAVNLFLGTTAHLAPARELLSLGGEVALSTDFNPGSAMTQDIGLILSLACTLYKMTPGEALRAVTIGAAKALKRDDLGRIRLGARAHLTLLSAPSLAYIPYFVGQNHVEGVIYDGQFVYWTESEPME